MPVGGFLPDLLRRGLTLGISGFFLTEELLRKTLGETVPRDWLEFATEQSERARNEFIDRLSAELRHVLDSVDLADVAKRLIEGRTVEVVTRIRLVPHDEEAGPRRRGASHPRHKA
jgi:hypothetical protein